MTEKTVEERLGDALEASAREEERLAPIREARQRRLDAVRDGSPRVIYRDDGRGYFGRGRPHYRALRAADVRFLPAEISTFRYFGDTKDRKRHSPDRVSIELGGSNRIVPPERLGDFVRRPTARALRRLEEAEAELARARAGVVAAERAAFTHGKPIPIATVKKLTRERKAAYEGDET